LLSRGDVPSSTWLHDLPVLDIAASHLPCPPCFGYRSHLSFASDSVLTVSLASRTFGVNLPIKIWMLLLEIL
jgi:hypothetical protein